MVISGATWAVQYQDGSEDWQYNAQSPYFDAVGGEVPYRAVEWSRVVRLTFSSGAVERVFDVAALPEGFRLSLHSRHFRTLDGIGTSCFLVVVSDAAAPTPKDGAVSVLYWFPDDTTHACHDYNCPDVARYGSRAVNGLPLRLVAEHGIQRIVTDAVLAA